MREFEDGEHRPTVSNHVSRTVNNVLRKYEDFTIVGIEEGAPMEIVQLQDTEGMILVGRTIEDDSESTITTLAGLRINHYKTSGDDVLTLTRQPFETGFNDVPKIEATDEPEIAAKKLETFVDQVTAEVPNIELAKQLGVLYAPISMADAEAITERVLKADVPAVPFTKLEENIEGRAALDHRGIRIGRADTARAGSAVTRFLERRLPQLADLDEGSGLRFSATETIIITIYTPCEDRPDYLLQIQHQTEEEAKQLSFRIAEAKYLAGGSTNELVLLGTEEGMALRQHLHRPLS